MEGAGTTLPQLTPAVDASGVDRRSRAGGPSGGSRSSSSHPYSARLARDDRSNYHVREEEAVRAVYKKHAQGFFEEIKEGFLKEAAILRKQCQKAFAKAAVPWDVAESEDSEVAAAAPVVANLQAQLMALQQQIGELQTASSSRQAFADRTSPEGFKESSRSSAASGSGHAGRSSGPSPPPKSTNGVSALSEKLARQEDEIKAISRLVRNEFAAAKKAALTPMWKERALQEIAQGELRAVCADEVGKAFRDFAIAFSEREAEAAVARLCESGDTPMERRMRAEWLASRAELESASDNLSRQMSELSCRADEGTSARAVLADRLCTVESTQRVQASEIARIEAELRSMHHEGVRELRSMHHEGVRELRSMHDDGLGVTKKGVDKVSENLSSFQLCVDAKLATMQKSLAEEASHRESGTSRVVSQLDALRVRFEDEQRQLVKQTAAATAASSDACTRVAEAQRSAKEDLERWSKVLSSTLEAATSAQQAATSAKHAADAARTRSDNAQRLADEVATEARGASAGAERARSVADAVRADVVSAKKAAEAAAAEVDARVVKVEASVAQQTKRLGTLDERLNAVDGRLIPITNQMQDHCSRLDLYGRQLTTTGEHVRRLRQSVENMRNAASAFAASSYITPSSGKQETIVSQPLLMRGSDSLYPKDLAHHEVLDHPEARAVADSMAFALLEKSCLDSCQSEELRVVPGDWMDMMSEDSRVPSVASMCRYSPESAC